MKVLLWEHEQLGLIGRAPILTSVILAWVLGRDPAVEDAGIILCADQEHQQVTVPATDLNLHQLEFRFGISDRVWYWKGDALPCG